MPRSNKPLPMPIEIVVEIDGRKYTGSYTVSGRVITVHGPDFASKSTQLGGSSADSLARVLMREMIREGAK